MANNNANQFTLSNGTPPTLDLYKLYGSSMVLREELDRIVRDAGFGSMSSINYLTMTGFNYLRHGNQMVRMNRDNMGFTFFTRPILNLTYDNLSGPRNMAHLRNAPANSVLRWVRATLDPWGQRGYWKNSNGNLERIANGNDSDTPLVDKYNPYIPLLSNSLISLSGFKDVAINDYTSKNGLRNEQHIMAEGFYHKTEAFELSASFRNMDGNPIVSLFQTWLQYIIECRQEYTMNPYPCFVEEREFDYNLGIYRFIMDNTRTYIQQWVKTIGFPMSVPFGNQFNFTNSDNFIKSNNEIPITFKCVGSDYNDPIVIYEFNKLAELYNEDLTIDYTQYDKENASMVVKGKDTWRKLKASERNRGVMMAIPLINYLTYELEWWIPIDKYIKYVNPTPNESPVKTTNQKAPKSYNTQFII